MCAEIIVSKATSSAYGPTPYCSGEILAALTDNDVVEHLIPWFITKAGPRRHSIMPVCTSHIACGEAQVPVEHRMLVFVIWHALKGRCGHKAGGHENADADRGMRDRMNVECLGHPA